MKHGLAATAIILSATVLSACASLTPPERPRYAGADSVDSAQPAQLVGVWAVTDLNPYPNSEPQNTIIEYRDDGTVAGTLVPQGESADALGNMQFELTGEWVLDGDTVIHENVTMNSTSDNAVGDLIGRVINKQEGISGQANIYELSTDRIVMVGSDGAAMEYIRQ